MISFDKLPEITKGKLVTLHKNQFLKHYIFDSRKAIVRNDSVFIAIKGSYHNGHDFLWDLYQKGIKNFIIENADDALKNAKDANVFLVNSSIKALQDIASYHRNKFEFPVIGITGSNGKTILKEWLAQMLSKKYHVAKSPQSFNSQLGVPLSILQIKQEHEMGVFEAGISMPDEMYALNQIIKPGIGVFTNLGTAHDENFSDKASKAKEKWRLFNDAKVVIYCKDHKLIDDTRPDTINSFTWGYTNQADVHIVNVNKSEKNTILKIAYGEEASFLIPFIDTASIENALHALVVMLYLGFDHHFIQTALKELHNVPRRLEIKEGINNTILIDDTYNNDLAGLTAGLTFLENQQQKQQSTLILSDMLQGDSNEERLYHELSVIVNRSGIDRMIGVGEKLMEYRSMFNIIEEVYPTTDAFLEAFNAKNFYDENILIKGARAFRFERITTKLQKKIHGTVLEINLDAITHNLNYYRSLLDPDVKVMAMVKAFAYGSGNKEVAKLLQFHKIDYLAVAYADEGVELRNNGITLPIMVMNCPEDTFDIINEYRLEPEIYSTHQLSALSRYLLFHKYNCRIHIKLDTGMHRLGFEENDIPGLIEVLTQNNLIYVASVFSHLAAADSETHDEFSKYQAHLFEKLASKIVAKLNYKPILHILNSPGIIRYPQFQHDMVRLGIGLYGYESNNYAQHKLRFISTLKTVISQVKKVKKGSTIGYGRKGKATQELTVATIAIGYADGFSRAFSDGRISINVNGKLCPVIGNVCMDMSMVDITGVDASEGDEVTIFGERPTIQALASAIDTIPYEVLTNIGDRVKRVFVSE